MVPLTGAQETRPVSGSDGEAEVVRLLENTTTETVHIRRDTEENARKIMQDGRVEADRILGAARTDAQGVAVQTAQDRQRARQDQELTSDDRVTSWCTVCKNDQLDIVKKP